MKLKRLFDFVEHQIDNYPQDEAICDLFEGTSRKMSIHDLQKKSNQIAHGLLALGLQPGDRIGMVMYRNRIEFPLLDIGIQKAGMVSVPLYPTISAHEYQYVLNDSQCKIVFFGSGDLHQKLEEARSKTSSLQKMYSIDGMEGFEYWEDFWAKAPVDPIGDEIAEEDLATLIYTSGTTGNPKGVMLSHKNIVSNVIAAAAVIPLQASNRAMSFLPLCHVFERATYFAYIYKGLSIHFTAIDNLGGEDGDLRNVKPHFLTCVPRLLEKIYAKIYQKGSELSGIKKKLFFWALDLTKDFAYDQQYTGIEKLKRTLADKLIFSKWREALGGNVIGIITGSAPCPERILQVFSAAGIPVREAYGLTESSPALTINTFEPGGALLGTVGPPIFNVEIKIDEKGEYKKGEGEILATGPNIMMGYYNNPEATKEVLFEREGKIWLRTGDIGKLVKTERGITFLKITDRLKELLKTSAGKYVAPAPIEGKLKEEFLIEQAMIVGDRRKFVSAIILPSEDALQNYFVEHKMEWQGLEAAILNQNIYAVFDKIVEKINAPLARHEQIKKYILFADNWTSINPDGTAGMLTPTLKLKRRVILEKYNDKIDDLYV